MLLTSQLVHVEHICLFFELLHVLKQPTWNVGLPPFQETWILKAFFTFHTLKIKTQNPNQPFIELETFTDNGRDVWRTSMMEPIPAGMRTSRLVCSSNKYRKITMVLKHLQSTTEPRTQRSDDVNYLPSFSRHHRVHTI